MWVEKNQNYDINLKPHPANDIAVRQFVKFGCSCVPFGGKGKGKGRRGRGKGGRTQKNSVEVERFVAHVWNAKVEWFTIFPSNIGHKNPSVLVSEG